MNKGTLYTNSITLIIQFNLYTIQRLLYTPSDKSNNVSCSVCQLKQILFKFMNITTKRHYISIFAQHLNDQPNKLSAYHLMSHNFLLFLCSTRSSGYFKKNSLC